MIVLVCGGRAYLEIDIVDCVLNTLNQTIGISKIIEGGAGGADKLSGKWADDNKIEHITENADWSKHGKAAGPIRNKNMLTHSPDLVIAFPGGRGTANMIKQAKEQGIKVIEPVYSRS